MKQPKRITVKVGSNVLTRQDGTLDFTRMSSLVDQIAQLRAEGIDVILVSSGAVASGRSELRHRQLDAMNEVEQRQLFSAVGQAKLIDRYYELFRDHEIPVGQVLTMKENFENGEPYNNMHTCMEVMLRNGVIPIVNENDTVAITELMFTDNDELSGLIARMMQSQQLILLSNIDGVYTGDPSLPESQLIREVKRTDDLSQFIQQKKSSAGRGGMTSKYNTARRIAADGIEVIIANGERDNVLCDLIHGSTLCTRFIP